jgi:hypothetical protein
MKDEIAYKCVKAMKWIIQNSKSKDEADEILATLQGNNLHEVMHHIVGYEDLPRLPEVQQVAD